MTLIETIAGPLPIGGIGAEIIAALVGALIVGVIVLANAAVAGPWAKRKITAAFVDRIAVDRLGPMGILTIVADSVRLLSKELIIPEGVDRPAYDIAPIILPASALLGFAVIPMGNGIQLADPEVGLAFVFAAASILILLVAVVPEFRPLLDTTGAAPAVVGGPTHEDDALSQARGHSLERLPISGQALAQLDRECTLLWDRDERPPVISAGGGDG